MSGLTEFSDFLSEESSSDHSDDAKILGQNSTKVYASLFVRAMTPCDLFAPCGAAGPVQPQRLVQVRAVEEANKEAAVR